LKKKKQVYSGEASNLCISSTMRSLIRVLLKSDQVWEIVINDTAEMDLCEAILQAIGCTNTEVDVIPMPPDTYIFAQLEPRSISHIALKQRVINLGNGQRIGIEI
jgi:hypothetical protein